MTNRTSAWALAATAAAAIATIAVAAGDPVAQRQAAMKHISTSMRDAGQLALGSAPWDAAKAKTIATGIATDAKNATGYFPAGSDKDPKTQASPAIWTNKADFTKRMADMQKLALAASKATTQETFKPAFVAIGGTCKGCHDLYRKKPA